MDTTADRSIPPYDGAELEPNFYCRGRNTKRAKYCAARAGYGTDHVGTGRCKHHGGARRSRTGSARAASTSACIALGR